MRFGLDTFGYQVFAYSIPDNVIEGGYWNEVCKPPSTFLPIDMPIDEYIDLSAADDGWTEYFRTYEDEYFKVDKAGDEWTDIPPDPEDPTIKRC